MYFKNFCCLVATTVACSASAQASNNFNDINCDETEAVCPKAGTWINCMPMLCEEVKFYCRQEVRDWVLTNCPDVYYAD